jgi:ribose transport system substrate-binding protein
MIAAAKTHKDVHLKVSGSSTFSPQAQTPIIQAAVSSHPDALITAATDSSAMGPPLQQVKQQGTKVILYDTGLVNKSIASTFVAADNYGGGKIIADALGKYLHGKGLVLPVDINPGVQSTNSRISGFKSEIKKYPGIKLLPVQFDQESAQRDAQIVQATLSAHPTLAAIVPSYNDAAIGVLAALKSSKGKKPAIFTFDADPAIVSAIKSGQIAEAATQQPYVEASTALNYTLDVLQGKHVPAQTLIPMLPVTAHNVNNPSTTLRHAFYVDKGCSS